MDTIKSYRDLCNEIEVLEWSVEAYKDEIKALNKLAKIYGPRDISAIDYSQPRVKGTNQIAFEDYLFRLRQLEDHIYLHEDAIKNMTKTKEKIKGKLKELKGLDKEVAYMRDIEGKSLKEIADELGYSYQYIKEVSARSKITY